MVLKSSSWLAIADIVLVVFSQASLTVRLAQFRWAKKHRLLTLCDETSLSSFGLGHSVDKSRAQSRWSCILFIDARWIISAVLVVHRLPAKLFPTPSMSVARWFKLKQWSVGSSEGYNNDYRTKARMMKSSWCDASCVIILVVMLNWTLEECVALRKYYSRPLRFRYAPVDQEISATNHQGSWIEIDCWEKLIILINSLISPILRWDFSCFNVSVFQIKRYRTRHSFYPIDWDDSSYRFKWKRRYWSFDGLEFLLWLIIFY